MFDDLLYFTGLHNLHASVGKIYCISQNRCAGCRDRKQTLILVWFQWNWQPELLLTLALSAKNLIEVGWVVVEICPVKVKSWGHIYSAKYSMCVQHSAMFKLNSLKHFPRCSNALKLNTQIWLATMTQYMVKLQTSLTQNRLFHVSDVVIYLAYKWEFWNFRVHAPLA